MLLVPELLYFTYSVSGSEPTAAIVCRTFAVTPDVPPVIVVPLNSFTLAVDVSLIKSYSVLTLTLPPTTLEPSLKLY